MRRFLRYLIETGRIDDYHHNCALDAVKHVTDADDESVIKAFQKSPHFKLDHPHHPLVVKDALHRLGWKGKKIPHQLHSNYLGNPYNIIETSNVFPKGRFLGFSGGFPGDYFDRHGRLLHGNTHKPIKPSVTHTAFGMKNGKTNVVDDDDDDAGHLLVSHLYKIRRR